ncbi:hypothetical protein PF005_g9674 [Phytophthora fragariae]|uniref:C2 domain-containing protein n=1 Tax=Phytophthora fragariae TaxID=53985 RepID=A0A6A3ZTG4_9STRA|nr:hypothetical protein PF006_g24078 [Phytophthora fragariae]KAE9214794.1 hypothetical protein PF005_g9674 [Phytophthora fragariae]KAE9240651.1 hypothetical protein PF002_g9669 [Phytophthora fragariae]KAE9309959.1 hypothetical protein PF001_g10434 [Phytophthora fragariae]
MKLDSAADLPLSDFSVAGSKSNPYVSLKLNGTKPHRPSLNNILNPVRDPPEHYIFPVRDPPEHYIFPVRDAASATLYVVYEKDTLNPDDLVCVLESPVPTCKFADEMDMSTLEFGDQSGRP